MHSKFIKFIQSEHLLDNITHIDIALSGGADSVCLTALLAKYRDEINPELYLRAHHIQHGLRDSDQYDAEIARQIADKFHIHFIHSELHLGNLTDNIEETARNARYRALFNEISDSETSKDTICLALAHHGDENTETALWRLGRGCGLEGLTLSPKRTINGIKIIRPMLCFSKQEIYSYLKENEIPWAEDPTNNSDHYLRNRIRHNVLPALYSNAMSADCIYQSLINIRHDTDALDKFAEYFVQSHTMRFDGWFCPYHDWNILNSEAKIQVLRHAARHILAGHGLTQGFVYKALEMIEIQTPDHRISTDERISVGYCKAGVMVWNNQRPDLPKPMMIPIPSQDCDIYQIYKLSVFHTQLNDSFKNTTSQLLISADCIVSDHLTIYPAGCFKTLETSAGLLTKTTEALRSQGVPDIWRNYWPILCDDDRPLWVLGGMRTSQASFTSSGVHILITIHV